MKFTYRLKRVCGSVYSNGNLSFSPDGQSVISPVGNRVNIFDLVNQTSDALPLESRKDVKLAVVSHNGQFLIVVDVDGAALFYHLPRRIILHRINFRQRVYDLKFSPNDQFFAITYARGCQIWSTPSSVREFCPLTLTRTISGHNDETTCLDWSPDSRSILLGSRDLTARVYYRALSKSMALSVLSGHRDALIGAFFGTSDQAYTIAVDGGLFSWQFDRELAAASRENKDSTENADRDSDADDGIQSGDSDDNEDEDEDENSPQAVAYLTRQDQLRLRSKAKLRQGNWKLTDRRLLRDNQGEVTACAHNRAASLLVLGFSEGVFSLYDLPDLSNLHRLSVSSASLSTVSLSPSGDWLALGCAELGQLLVWEWKSESTVLKQQGHLYGLRCVDYSSDGQFLASGGEDGKLKLWSTQTGFCIITFADHLAPITGVRFVGTGRGQALLSSSLDGTVRAHDLLRYKNFKTLTTPTPVQLTCLCTDPSGEIVCAGALDPFHIYVWSLQTGKLIEVLSGHEGPIACVDFCPSTSSVASGSWDGTCKVWNIYGNACTETFEHGCDVLAVAFRSDGKELCTATTSGNLTIWDVEAGTQVKVLEGQGDLAGGRLTTDKRSSATNNRSRFFTSITYSADGSCVLAGGRSKYVCVYAVEAGVLCKKYQLSYNRSLEGVQDRLRSDNLVDGIAVDNMLPTGPGDDPAAGATGKRTRALPGAAQGSGFQGVSGTHRAELMCSAVRFSPTGQEWVAASTQGLQVYALDDSLVFAPVALAEEIVPQNVFLAIGRHEYALAMNMALCLGERTLLASATTAVPLEAIELVAQSLDLSYINAFMKFLADQLASSTEVGYWLQWTVSLLRRHGGYLQSAKGRLAVMESLRALLRVCVLHEKDLLRVSQDNLFLASYLCDQMHESRDRLADLEAQRLAEQHVSEEEREEGQEESSFVLPMEGSDSGEEVPWAISMDGSGMAWNSAWDDHEDDEDEDDEDEDESPKPQDKKKKKGKQTPQMQSGGDSQAARGKDGDGKQRGTAAAPSMKKKKEKKKEKEEVV